MLKIANSLIILDFHLFKFGVGSFDNPEKIVADGYFFAGFRNTFVIMNDISGQSFVVVRLREIVFVGLVEIVYFKSGGENPVVFVDGFLDVVFLVVLVFDLSENLLHEVFGGYDASCASEFIDYDGYALTLFRQSLK